MEQRLLEREYKLTIRDFVPLMSIGIEFLESVGRVGPSPHCGFLVPESSLVKILLELIAT